MVYISFLISHVPPAHSFFQKKSILENLCQICGNLLFAAYQLMRLWTKIRTKFISGKSGFRKSCHGRMNIP